MNRAIISLFSLTIFVEILLLWLAFLIFRSPMTLLTSLEGVFIKLNFKLLIFILSIIGCLTYELAAALIGSILFCNYEQECSMMGIRHSICKRVVKVEQISFALDMTFLFSIRLIFHLLTPFLCKVRQNRFPKCPIIRNILPIYIRKILPFSSFEKFFAKFF